MEVLKNYARKPPAVRLTLRDVAMLRATFMEGDTLKIETPVWESNRNHVRKKLKATVDRVCPHGVRFRFDHKNGKDTITCYRWLGYVDMILQTRDGRKTYLVETGEM